MKFVLATAVAVACLNLALGSRQLRELSSCQQELRRLQCTASLPSPPPKEEFSPTDSSNTTNTTTAAPTTRRLALCHRRLSQCQANLPAATPAPVTTAPATAAAAAAAKPDAPASDSKASTDDKCCSNSEDGSTLLDVAQKTPDLSELVKTITTKADDPAALTSVLGGAGPITVMAPNNASFTAAAPTAATLTSKQVTDLIKYHVIPGGRFCAADLKEGTNQVETALAGCNLTITKDASGVTVNGKTKVVGADVCGSNGVAHVVDGVLLPPKDVASCKFYDTGAGGGGATTTAEPKMVGGCAGTRYGCCPDGTTSKASADDTCAAGSSSPANETGAAAADNLSNFRGERASRMF